jgi:hypothetical protein
LLASSSGAFFIFGLDGFLEFIPRPTTPGPEGAVAFSLALVQTGYMIPLIKGTELVAGALLLTNRFVPLALVLLAPVIVNIVAFHVFLAPAGAAPILIMVVGLELLLAYANRASYRPLLVRRASDV